MKKYLTPKFELKFFELFYLSASELDDGVFEGSQDDPWLH